MLLGDLSPFDINNFGVRMTKENLIKGISKTIGAVSTAKLGGIERVELTRAYRGDGNKITQNALRMRFR